MACHADEMTGTVAFILDHDVTLRPKPQSEVSGAERQMPVYPVTMGSPYLPSTVHLKTSFRCEGSKLLSYEVPSVLITVKCNS